MGNKDDFFRKYPELEDLIREYMRIVNERGDPKRFWVLNETRMQELNTAASIVRTIANESDPELEFEVALDEDDKSSGRIEVRGYHWGVLNNDSFLDLQYAEELADSFEIDVSDDDKFVYTLGFKNLMTLKLIKI